MENKRIGVFVGSLRKESFCKSIAWNAIELAPDGLQFEVVELGDLAMFNQDFDDEGRTPAEWTAFREKVKEFDGVLFISPEYNRSVPPVLKNALDIGSRPYGANVWDGKPGAVISVSPGGLGGFGANHHLRQSLAFLNVITMGQPEAYIADVTNSFDENRKVNDRARTFLQGFMNAFAAWVEKN